MRRPEEVVGERRERRNPLGAALTVAALDADPHPHLARLRRTEPVSWVPALGAWLVTRRDLALRVMRDPETFTVDDPRFSTGRIVGRSMLNTDGAEHDRHRGPFAPPFRVGPVRRQFSTFVAAETDRLLDAVARDGECDLRRSLTGPLAAAVIGHAVGLGPSSTPSVLSWYATIVEGVTRITAGEPVPQAARTAFGELREAVLAATDRGPGSSLVAAAVRGAGALDPEEAVPDAAVIMFGGIETTDAMIANAVLHLLLHPDQAALVETEPDLLQNAIEESLRLEPAAAVIDRYATRDVELDGAAIEAGEPVTISLAGANRDPAAFAEPDRFDVRRANARVHVAFAHGPHVCIGLHLARLEARTAVARVLERLPALRLVEPREAAPRGLVFRKPPVLRVRWDRS